MISESEDRDSAHLSSRFHGCDASDGVKLGFLTYENLFYF